MLRSSLTLIITVSLSMATGACGEKSADTEEMGVIGAGIGSSGGGKLWQRLGAYKGSYLRSWKGAFTNPKPAPRDVLDAFQEVGFATTGPTGFWRDKVPNQWFGCQADASSTPCKTLKGSLAELTEWDAFQARISNLADGRERAFLAKNQAKMIGYLDMFVPSRHSETEMKATGFYKEHLAAGLSAGPSAGDDDL